jgi:predicted CXXCH cytochrome family protein
VRRLARHLQIAWRWRKLLAVTSWLVLIIAWSGCSVKKNYEVLSFFFDGVPDPNAPAPGAAGQKSVGGVQLQSPTSVVSRHKPFVEQDCKSCHSGGGDLAVNALTNTPCMACHKETPTQHAVMHGPVASGACLWCHAPHEAALPRLLRARSPDLCVQCHERPLLTARVPQHADEKEDCMSCHVGHGGPNRHLLRDDAARAAGLRAETQVAPKPSQ